MATVRAKVTIVPAEWDHLFHISNHMRRADIDECAAVGLGPFHALALSFEQSVEAWTALVGDKPACMLGVAPLDVLGGVGSPWLLGTDELKHRGLTLSKLTRPYLDKMLELFPVLVNYVDARQRAITWLKWIGFKFDPNPVPYGPFKKPFYRFEMRLQPESPVRERQTRVKWQRKN